MTAPPTALTARKYVTPGSHTVIFSIFDVGDGAYDSAVFIDNLRVTSEPPEQCRSLGLDPFDGDCGHRSDGEGQALQELRLREVQDHLQLCRAGRRIPCQPFMLAFVNFQTGQLGRA